MKNTMLWTRCFSFILVCIYKPNSVSASSADDRYLSRPKITLRLKRFSAHVARKSLKLKVYKVIKSIEKVHTVSGFKNLITFNFKTKWTARYAHGTILHTCKDLAVSLSILLWTSPFAYAWGDFFLSKKIVSARTSGVTTDGYYPLHFPSNRRMCVRTFLTLPCVRAHLSNTDSNTSLSKNITLDNSY